MKKHLLFIIKIIVSGILLYLIFRKIDCSQLTVSFKQANFFNFFLGIIFGLVFNLVKFMKWRNLIRTGSHKCSYWDGAKSYMIGNALGIITPMRAGDLGRALYFPTQDRPKIIGLTIIDRLMDLAAVLVLCIAGGFLLINTHFGILVSAAFAVSLLILYSPVFLSNIVAKNSSNYFLKEKLRNLFDILKILDLRTISISLFLSLMAFILTVFEFYYIVGAFEKSSLIMVFLATPLITLSALLPITFMGLGVREGLSVYLFSMFGVANATGFSAAFLGFVINNVSISLIGIIYLSKIRLTYK